MSFPDRLSSFVWLVSFALALPLVYLLAMGPLWGLAIRHPERYGAAVLLYGPVVRIAEEHPVLDSWISAYVERWYPKDASHKGSITMKQIKNGAPAPVTTP